VFTLAGNTDCCSTYEGLYINPKTVDINFKLRAVNSANEATTLQVCCYISGTMIDCDYRCGLGLVIEFIGSSASMLMSLLASACPTTNSLLQLTPRVADISHQPPAHLTVISALSPNGSWPSSYSLRMGLTENTTSNSNSIVACMCVEANT
jgi:hypothetical protein